MRAVLRAAAHAFPNGSVHAKYFATWPARLASRPLACKPGRENTSRYNCHARPIRRATSFGQQNFRHVITQADGNSSLGKKSGCGARSTRRASLNSLTKLGARSGGSSLGSPGRDGSVKRHHHLSEASARSTDRVHPSPMYKQMTRRRAYPRDDAEQNTVSLSQRTRGSISRL